MATNDKHNYYYDLPEIEPGCCFYDDRDHYKNVYYRFNHKTNMIGDYSCDMIQIYNERIIMERDFRCMDLYEMKEMDPQDFDKLEKLISLSLASVKSLCGSTNEKLKQRHLRRITKPKQ